MHYHPAAYTIAQTLLPHLQSIAPEANFELEGLKNQIQEAPQIQMGQYAFGVFPLAKTLKKAPPMIAKELEALLHNTPDPAFKSIKAMGPYLNFAFTSSFLFDHVVLAQTQGPFFQQRLIPNSLKTMVEYSQPNTHKVLHVGHMRNLCLGNALVRLMRYAGVDVTAVTYPGDMGTHVAKTLWYMKYHCQEQAPADEPGAWLGELYTLATHKLEDEKGSALEDKNREQLTAILKQLENKQGEFFDLWVQTRQWSLDLMNKAYTWADVEFDRWFFESEFDAPSLKLMREYQAQGILKEDQGAVGMDLSEDKLGFCLLIKSDGTGLYATKDIALAKKKFEEFKIEQNIYVVDNRQARHFQQVFKVLEKIGFKEAKNCYHLQYDVVELPDGAMSSRKGNIVPLMSLIEAMEKTITERYLERYRGVWSDEEIIQTAHMVAGGAIKYGMIRIDNNRKIVFDQDEWLKLDGDTGPYLQYVHARIQSILTKIPPQAKADANLLTHEIEEKLLVKLSVFNEVVVQAVRGLKTVGLCSYLFELGKLFNQFYAECPIAKADSLELQAARLELSKATALTLKKGLELIGISAPMKM
jgi:arginyl-tRNA synthetase